MSPASTGPAAQINSHGCVIAALLCCLQLKRLSAAVSFGGGRSQLLEEGSLPRDLLESPQSCVIDVTTGSSQALLPSSTTEWAKSVQNIVQRFAQTPVFFQKNHWVCFGNLLVNAVIEHLKLLSPWHRKCLRVITESEIGLAAIYASCDQYCNPSNLTVDSRGWPHRKAPIAVLSLFFYNVSLLSTFFFDLFLSLFLV